MSCKVIPVSATLLLLLASIVLVVSGSNMTLEEVLMSSLQNSSSSSIAVTSLSDAGMNGNNNRSSGVNEAVGSSVEQQLLRTGALSEWLSQLKSSEDDDDALSSWSSSSSYASNSILARFIQQVTNRTALCQLLNGTCVAPANCAVLGLTLGYDYGRGSSSDVGKYFSCDATSTICCYPFLLTRLSPTLYTRYHSDVDDDELHQLDGFQTIYEYWYPRRQRRWRKPTTTRRRNRYNGRKRGYDRFSRRRYRGNDRSAFFRSSGSLTDYSPGPMYYFAAGYAADVDGVNYTAMCESRRGICTRAADCTTNSAVDLTGTGSGYAGHVADGVNSDQIRSFLCNLTSICCLPKPIDAKTGRQQIDNPGPSLSQQVSGEFSSVMCALINGTCLPASQCLTSGLSGALYGRAVNFRCNPTTVCCRK